MDQRKTAILSHLQNVSAIISIIMRYDYLFRGKSEEIINRTHDIVKILELPDKRLVVATTQDVSITNLKDPTFYLNGHQGFVQNILLKDSNLIVIFELGYINIWDLNTNELLANKNTLKDYDNPGLIDHSDVLSNGDIVLIVNKPAVIILDSELNIKIDTLLLYRCKFLATYKNIVVVAEFNGYLRILIGHSGIDIYTTDIATSLTIHLGKVYLGKQQGTIDVLDITNGSLLNELKGHKGAINCITFLPNGKMVTGSEDRSIIVWDDITPLRQISGPPVGIKFIEVLPNNNILVSGDKGSIGVLDPETGKRVQLINNRAEIINDLIVLSTGKFIVVTYKYATLWE
jgi:WD40 repeat protein